MKNQLIDSSKWVIGFCYQFMSLVSLYVAVACFSVLGVASIFDNE